MLQEVVATVNFVNSSALNHWLFEETCVGFGSEYKHLLFHSNVRWLSRGKVLRRTVDLRTELEIFLNEKNHRLATRFEDKSWMLKVCYLNNIFTPGNEHFDAEQIPKHRCALRKKVEQFEEFDFDTIKLVLMQHFKN